MSAAVLLSVFFTNMPQYYNIFRTDWGYFGLVGSKHRLLGSFLPAENDVQLERTILASYPEANYNADAFGDIHLKIFSYYSGEKVDFSPYAAISSTASLFSEQILRACVSLKYGETSSYGRLAKMANRPGTCRAVGTVLRKNKLPLIIPCHRVIRSDGSVGMFSANGGSAMKQRMLELEMRVNGG